MNYLKTIFLFLLYTIGINISAQCDVNAGGSTTICGTEYILNGSSTNTNIGTVTWTILSKPAGAPDPIFSNANVYKPTVTNMVTPGSYTFQITKICDGGTSISNVTITAPGAITGFTAGSDITNISAITGVATLSGIVPDGYTASWTYYHIRSYERNGNMVTTNATMSNTGTATPTLSLIKKVDHDIDPAYMAVLRITSVNNPNCWYEDETMVRFVPNP